MTQVFIKNCFMKILFMFVKKFFIVHDKSVYENFIYLCQKIFHE